MSENNERAELIADGQNQSIVEPKYSRPKVLLLDLPQAVFAAVQEKGYNAKRGSWGMPFKVNRDSGSTPVLISGDLPNYDEQEIVITDLAVREVGAVRRVELPPSGTAEVFMSNSRGMIEPRPRLMSTAREKSEQILEHGGIFVFFCDSRLNPEYFVGELNSYNQLYEDSKYPADTWSILADLKRFETGHGTGSEITPKNIAGSSLEAIGPYLENASYRVTMDPSSWLSDRWIPIAENKYGEAVGGLLLPENAGEGLLLLLPQVEDKSGTVLTLLNQVLPDLVPRLFPSFEGSKWTERREYEHPEVVAIRDEIEAIESKTRETVNKLEAAEAQARVKFESLRLLLTATGDALVSAVQATLTSIGFEQVEDVDAQVDEANGEQRREDLRVSDREPTLLIEVKGIGNKPKEDDALKVRVYVARRVKEWKSFEISGLFIVNHERHLPALERDNEAPFQEDVLTTAEEDGIGLLTTWDLFRLARGKHMHGWSDESVKDVLYGTGRIEPVPSHYEFIGTVDRVWEQAGAVTVDVSSGTLSRGDRIAFELPVDFMEQVAESLQVDRVDVETGEAGQQVGIATRLDRHQAKSGTRVFRITDSDALEIPAENYAGVS